QQAQTLPEWLQISLQIAAGLVGASAVLLAILTFTGWQYANSYYETLGIPFSTLSFSSQEYAFFTHRTLIFVSFGLIAAGGGIITGLWPSAIGSLINAIVRAIGGIINRWKRLPGHNFPPLLILYFVISIGAVAAVVLIPIIYGWWGDLRD